MSAFSHKTPQPGDALRRFLSSMQLDYEKWHDGIGYDLAALGEMTPDERESVQATLLARQPQDWRDVEALAAIDSAKARAAVVAALKHPDIKVRQQAMRHVPESIDNAERTRHLVATLRSAELYSGLSQAIDEAEEFHPPEVIRTLLQGALDRDGEAAVHFAAMLCFLHHKAAEPFDWSMRPFFLRFHTEDRAARRAVFAELCTLIGVDAAEFDHKQ